MEHKIIINKWLFFGIVQFLFIRRCKNSFSSPKCCFTPPPCLSTINLTSIPADSSEYYMWSCKAVRLWASGELEACVKPAGWENLLFHLLCSPTLLSSRPPTSTAVMNKTRVRVCYVCADSLWFKWSSRQARLRLQVVPWLVTHTLTRRSPGEGQTAFEDFAPLKIFHALNGPSVQEK